MHRPKQFAQMESEAERRRKTRSLRASLLKRGWLRENKQSGLTSWATEREGGSESEGGRGGERESVGEMTKWTERERQRWKIGLASIRDGEARTTNLPLYWQKLSEGSTEKHSELKAEDEFSEARWDSCYIHHDYVSFIIVDQMYQRGPKQRADGGEINWLLFW